MGVGIKGFGGTAAGIKGISALPPAAVAAKNIFGAAVSTVPVTEGLVIQLDAENSTFSFSSGTLVSQWDDLSGNGNHATNLAALGQGSLDPGTLSPTPNSKPFVTDRSGNFGFHIPNSVSSSITVKEAFFVTRYYNPTWVQFQGWINPNINGSPYWIFGGSPTREFIASAFDSFFLNNTEQAANVDFGVDLDIWAIYHMRSSAGLSNAAGFNLMHIESASGFATSAWRGDVAEMLVYDTTLSSEDLTSVLDYLAAKYDITIA